MPGSLLGISRSALLPVYAAVVVLIAAAALLAQWWLALEAREQSRLFARLAAQNLSGQVQQLHDFMRLLAEDPKVAALLSAPAPGRTAFEQKLQARFPEALRFRLLPETLPPPDHKADPPLSYACLDLLQRSAGSPDRPRAEAHLLGEPGDHLDLATVIREGGDVRGYMLLSLRPRWLSRRLQRYAEAGTYMELRQEVQGEAALPLASTGDAALAGPGAASASAVVEHAPWRITVWREPAFPVPLSQLTVYGIALVLILAALLLAPLWFGHRLKRAVAADTRHLGHLIGDIRSGRTGGDYPIRLKEFRRLAGALARSGKKMLVEQERLLKSSLTDDLTGLASETAFQVRLQQLLDQTRLGFPSSVLLIDVDGLRRINNEHDHETGDRVIRHLARNLKETLRQSDLVARLHGGLFGVILSFTDADSAVTGVSQLRKKMATVVPLPSDQVLAFTWSCGLSVLRPEDQNEQAVMERCRHALAEAKKQGGDRTVHDFG